MGILDELGGLASNELTELHKRLDMAKWLWIATLAVSALTLYLVVRKRR